MRVTSCDPLYAFSAEQIRERIAATAEDILEQTRRHRDEFVWDEITSLEHLQRLRMSAMEDFLADYDAGRSEGRYIAAEEPSLPFPDGSFHLAICSHFLFLYSEQLGQQFHEDAIVELCRVAAEVRIFLMIALGSVPSPHVEHDGHQIEEFEICRHESSVFRTIFSSAEERDDAHIGDAVFSSNCTRRRGNQ